MIKLAVAIAGESAPASAFVVWRGFEDSIKKAADLGYDGVELALKTADDVDPEKLATWLDTHTLGVSCITTGQVFASLGLYFTHPDPESRKAVFNVFSRLIHLARYFGGMVNVGRARGCINPNQSREEAEGLFADMMLRLCDVAAPLGVIMLLEPVNRYEIDLANSLDEGAVLLRKVDRANVGLMPDIFHMNIEDDVISRSLLRNAPLVKYIHLADSNRLAPGWGHLDFGEVFDALREMLFDGWASIEILPKPDPDAAARQAAEHILPHIRRYNEELGQ